MLILLPPSEAKRPGGGPGTRLDLDGLRFRGLTEQRRTVLRAVRELARDIPASLRALGLAPDRAAEAEKNLAVESSPVMPAVLRHSGVLFDALDPGSLPEPALELLGRCVVVHTALLGPVGALDAIPDYRLSAGSRLPGLPLGRLWRDAVRAELSRTEGLVIDARSRAYAALGAAPPGALPLEVVAEGPGGTRRALNHFNKKAKGELVRALALGGDPGLGLEGLLEWAPAAGLRLELAEAEGVRRLVLVV